MTCMYIAAHCMKFCIPVLSHGSATQTEVISVLRQVLKNLMCFTTKNEMCRLMKVYVFFHFTVKKNDNVKLMGPITYGMKYSIYNLLQLA